MAHVVVYDACVLYPSTLRDLLIRIAQSGLVQAKWSDRILDEVFDNLAENRPDLDAARLARTRRLMVRAIRDGMVVGYEPLIEAMELPDPDDRHVLAAAVKSRAHQIVTRNLKDFPASAVSRWGVRAGHPDDFVMEQIEIDRPTVFAAVHQIANSWRNPPGSVSGVLDRLEKDGLIESVAALRF
ncbi:PIN domain-containing protein [Streptomyces boluensis]|uniref:PIN domain-containing protein n=1 Tax=Streptomyces boluensis TaxID=1775135 RepID=A0A964XP60_9ACTN|nr:PIN domain-containing protein [Streptomyces boluensis]NBE54472.1 PIN domain-containing protein [Streptomyces boluensis]